VHAVEDGEAALRYLKSGAEVDVLFTDINLAGRMDGSMLAREARAQRPNCRSSIVPGAIRPLRWRRRCRVRSS
jgi:CheY-like chemotaxis protein